MNTAPNSEEFYEKLKGQLHETTNWPSEYLYKFILFNLIFYNNISEYIYI